MLNQYKPKSKQKTISKLSYKKPSHLITFLLVAAVVAVGVGHILIGSASQFVGDFNNDGTVNIFDLSIFLNHWQQNGTGIAEDLNNDGVVNVFDLSKLLSNYGKYAINAPSINLSANSNNLFSGQSSTLSWSSTNASSCVAISPASWTQLTTTSGSQTVSPTFNTTYTISCSGTGGTTSSSTTIAVNYSWYFSNGNGSCFATQTSTNGPNSQCNPIGAGYLSNAAIICKVVIDNDCSTGNHVISANDYTVAGQQGDNCLYYGYNGVNLTLSPDGLDNLSPYTGFHTDSPLSSYQFAKTTSGTSLALTTGCQAESSGSTEEWGLTINSADFGSCSPRCGFGGLQHAVNLARINDGTPLHPWSSIFGSNAALTISLTDSHPVLSSPQGQWRYECGWLGDTSINQGFEYCTALWRNNIQPCTSNSTTSCYCPQISTHCEIVNASTINQVISFLGPGTSLTSNLGTATNFTEGPNANNTVYKFQITRQNLTNAISHYNTLLQQWQYNTSTCPNQYQSPADATCHKLMTTGTNGQLDNWEIGGWEDGSEGYNLTTGLTSQNLQIYTAY